MYGSRTFWAFEQWYAYAKQHYMSSPDGRPPQWLTFCYDPIINLNHKPTVVLSWLWWAFFLLPNDREMARLFFAATKEHFLVERDDGSAFVRLVPGVELDEPWSTIRALCIANELGDAEVARKLRAHAEARYEPTWDRVAGEFYYLFGLREPYPRGQYNAVIMMSEVGDAGTWWRLFNEPNLKKFEEPTVHGVDYPRMGLSQAYYDRQQRTLVLRTYPIEQSAIGSSTSFRVKNLARPGDYTVLADGAPYDGWAVRDDELEITTTVDYHSFQIVER
jgi:hypothetical protein